MAKGGPEAISVRVVAEQVGTTTRAVYSVFGSMAGLVEGLAARGFRILTGYTTNVTPTDDPAADLVTVGIAAFRRFAVERPHLFRITFERPVAGIVSTPTVGSAAMASYEVLSGWVRRAQAAGLIEDRPIVEIVFAFHAMNLGLASSELSREPPPIGSNFWVPAWGIDAESLWRTALEALVAGLAPKGEESRPATTKPRGNNRARQSRSK